MKKLLIILFLLPILVSANVKEHYISAEIEIAGGLNVKELIITENKTSKLKREINYKNEKENNKQKDITNLSLYNGHSIENLKVSAFKADEDLSIDNVDQYFKKFFKEGTKADTYTKEDTNIGYKITINNRNKYDQTAYYIEYLVSNVMVMHNDVAELNYAFKNIDYNSDNTIFKLVIPYPTNDDEYMFWFKGPKDTNLKELVFTENSKVGLLAEMPHLKNSFKVRMTLPKTQIGINMYLTKTNIDAFEQIKKYENDLMNKKDYTVYKVVAVYIVLFAISYIAIKIIYKKGLIKWFSNF